MPGRVFGDKQREMQGEQQLCKEMGSELLSGESSKGAMERGLFRRGSGKATPGKGPLNRGFCLRLAYLLTVCFILFGLSCAAFADSVSTELDAKVKVALEKTVSYLHSAYKKNDFKNVLDWPAVGLWAAGENLTSEKWSAQNGKTGLQWREQEVKAGVMLDPKSTDYERTILGIMAGGGNPHNFAGIDLLSNLKGAQLASGKFADTIDGQGEYLVNAHIWGIISLYASGEKVPDAAKAYKWLAGHQNDDGGFGIDIADIESDIDVTAMSLIALAVLGKEADDPVAKGALGFLKTNMKDDGNFYSWGEPTSESCAMVVKGLVALGIDPASDDWSTGANNPVTALLNYQLSDGSFAHVMGGRSDGMATQNALIALADYHNGESVYKALHQVAEQAREQAAQEKNQQQLLTDVDAGHWAYGAIKSLVDRDIISGYPDGSFQPEKEVKRAEFVKLMVLGLGLQESLVEKSTQFHDLPTDHWANEYIRVAVNENLVNGVSATAFEPEGAITGEQVMAILVRALNERGLVNAEMETEPWYEGYVQAAGEKGLLYPDFVVGKAAARSQCAYSIDKFLEVLNR